MSPDLNTTENLWDQLKHCNYTHWHTTVWPPRSPSCCCCRVEHQNNTSCEEYEPKIVGCHRCTWWEYFVLWLCANYKVWGLCPELDTGYAIKVKWNVFLGTKNNATPKIPKYPLLILKEVYVLNMIDWYLLDIPIPLERVTVMSELCLWEKQWVRLRQIVSKNNK